MTDDINFDDVERDEDDDLEPDFPDVRNDPVPLHPDDPQPREEQA